MKMTIRTGTSVMARMEENATERVFVQARGRNMRPSWASRRKTGRKETRIRRSGKKIAGKSFDGVVDEAGAVVAGNDFDAGGQRWLEFGQPFLYAVDDGEGVQAVAHDDDAADGFAFAVPFGDSLADVRAESDSADV